MRCWTVALLFASALALPSAPASARVAAPQAMRESAETLLQKTFDEIARQRFDAGWCHVVNSGKTWIRIKLSNVTAFRSPGKEDLVVVSFDQDYRSSNVSNMGRKRQYWQREAGRWRIVYEGSI